MTVPKRCQRIRTASKRTTAFSSAVSSALSATWFAPVLAALAGCGGGSGDAPPAAAVALPADPLLPYQWHLVNTRQPGDPVRPTLATAGVDINVAPVWEQGIDGRGVTVAVVENGLETGHEDLRANIAAGLSANGRTGSNDPTPAGQLRLRRADLHITGIISTKNMPTYRWLAASAAALLWLHSQAALASATATATTTQEELYWYDGAIKTPLYRQPQPDLPSHRQSKRPGAHEDRAARQARTQKSDPRELSARSVYSTGAGTNSGRLTIQAPGVLFTVTDDAGAKRAHAWLASRGVRAEPIAGERALNFANALSESGLVRYAQSNRVIDIDGAEGADATAGTDAPAHSVDPITVAESPLLAGHSRNVERAISDALAPPRQRCAGLRAAIDQAVADARSGHGARANSQFGWDRRSGSSMPGPQSGNGGDRRTRLENEYTQLDCARRAP